MPNVEPKVIIRLGSHSEKDYLAKTIRFFDGIIIGANLFEVTPGATSSLLLKFAGRNSHLGYYIDPMTYAFGAYIDRETGKLREDLHWIKSRQEVGKKVKFRFKSSYTKLAEKLGPHFQRGIKESKALTSPAIAQRIATKDFCRRVMSYQLNRVPDEFQRDDELEQFAGDVPRPSAVFAPYFYIEPRNLTMLTKLNLRLVTISCSVSSEVPVHAVICADESALTDEGFLDQIKTDLPKSGVKGVWLWFSKFSETIAERAQLKAFRLLVEHLHKAGLEVHNMHGGYFSLALSAYGMSAISHGVGYGEQKDVVPVIGQSRPTVRYYVPALHKRFGVPQIERCFDQLNIGSAAEFHDRICDCVVCKGVVGKDLEGFKDFGRMYYARDDSKRRSQTPAAAKRCRFHFLINRIREKDRLRGSSLSEILTGLETALEQWSGLRPVRREIGHLKLWRDALAEG